MSDTTHNRAEVLTDAEITELAKQFDGDGLPNHCSAVLSGTEIIDFARALLAQAAPQQEPSKLEVAIEFIRNAPHGDNCFVSAHYEGDPGDRCNCGKDSLLDWLEADTAPVAAQPQEAGQARELPPLPGWIEYAHFGPYDSRDIAEAMRDYARTALAQAAPAVPDIKEMVNHFLGWPLPKDFAPDCGISFDGRKDDEWNKGKTWPIGTNLLSADQAKAMFLHCLSVAPSAPAQKGGAA